MPLRGVSAAKVVVAAVVVAAVDSVVDSAVEFGSADDAMVLATGRSDSDCLTVTDDTLCRFPI